jgi:hypothetical protein
LRSKKARQTSVAIVRAFIALKQFALNYQDILEKLNDMESKNTKQFNEVYEIINFLLDKDQMDTEQALNSVEMEPVGFKLSAKKKS